MNAGRLNLLLGHSRFFFLPSNLAFRGLDAVGDLRLIPLDAFKLCRGLLKCPLHDRKLARECGKTFTHTLTLLTQGNFFRLHFFHLLAELLHGILLFHELHFKAFQLHTQGAHFSFAAQH